MATIVGFDTDRNERYVFQVHYSTLCKEDGSLDDAKALKALLMQVIVGHESEEPTDEQVAAWWQMPNAELYLMFDDLAHVQLMAVFEEDVEDKLVAE